MIDSIEKVQATVQGLLDRTYPLLVLLGKGSGQREDRYSHTLCGEVDISKFNFDTAPSSPKAASSSIDSDALQRIETLEAKVEKLEALLNELME